MTTQTVPPMGKVHPELTKILSEQPPAPSAYNDDIPAMRAMLSERKRALTRTMGSTSPPAGVTEKDIQIPSRDVGRSIPCRVHAPTPETAPKEGSPLFVIFHGGGFCLGGLENEELHCRIFAKEFGVVMLNVDYRLAPENKFPAASNDAWDVVKWAASHASELNANLKQGFIVGGISAGGNLSATVGHIARDEKLSPPITGLYLSIPALAGPGAIPEKYKDLYTSNVQNANPPGLGEEAMRVFTENYGPDQSSPIHAPLGWPTGHANLPPTYFQICELDPLRDDAVIFEKILREEHGVPTKYDFYPGLPHGFWSFHPEAAFSKQVPKDGVAGLAWLLEKGKRK
ncbi:MAG: hypothetical protein M1821_009509 [Bathelium mastoideum]|nr:MAG: hypothetical protein M1821_009509 [Bathelium mastoideum]KAI9688732.1 MAG: hypothetical protein M1822_001089 [Bathelium mastoideum]